MNNKDEYSLFNFKNKQICGVDEAGRGSIAGPLVVSGVILNSRIDGVKDSKKLSHKKREELYKKIVSKSKYHIVIIDNNKIDKLGLSKSLNIALNEIKQRFIADEVNIIFDGNSSFGVSGIQTIVKADDTISEVSSASILSKVTRDRIMLDYSKIYPNYGFEAHKGYCTKKHIEAIMKFGLCEIHRKSFKIPINSSQKKLFN